MKRSAPIDPVLVEITRGLAVESAHRGAAAIVDASGNVVVAWGNIDVSVMPRSAVKPIQALPLVETGAASSRRLTQRELALACASHSGEWGHVAAVRQWLHRQGLAPRHLQCGKQLPTHPPAAARLLGARRKPTALHNNCSGKHTGFLTTAHHLGEPLCGYIDAQHPVQRRVSAALSEMSDYDVEAAPYGIDGCGIPVRALPLAALARAMARFGRPQKLGAIRAQACQRLYEAMLSAPWLVGGTDRFDTRAMEAGSGAFIVKTGAEGVHVAVAPRAGLGIALKMNDGATRAAEAAMAALLVYLKLITPGKLGLQPDLSSHIRNNHHDVVGAIRPATSWLN